MITCDDASNLLARGVRARGVLLSARRRDDELVGGEREFRADSALRRGRCRREQTFAPLALGGMRVFGRERAYQLP